jgi:hypothetical protein
MDADGQHAIADIPGFLAALDEDRGVGMVIGARSMKFGIMPVARIFSNRTTSAFLSLLSGRRIHDSQCGFRLYSAELLRLVHLQYDRFEMESEIILKAARLGFETRFIAVQTLYLSGRSHIAHLRDTIRWVLAVMGVWRKLHGRAGLTHGCL